MKSDASLYLKLYTNNHFYYIFQSQLPCLLAHVITLILYTIYLNKLNKSYLELFISSIFCGALMYLAVELYKKKSNSLYVIMPIMIFILCMSTPYLIKQN